MPAMMGRSGHDAVEGPGSLSEHFADLARALHAQQSPQRTLDAICVLAVELIEGADHAGVTVVRGQRFETVAASDEVLSLIDDIQYRTNEGPCLDAIRDRGVFFSDDLAAERRWPHFVPRVMQQTAVRSILSYQLFVQQDTLGALNLYADRAGSFSDSARTVGKVFAAHAAVAYHAAKQQDQIGNLHHALDTSRQIGAAVGILMERHRITAEQAFDRLRNASQQTHRKLRDVADHLAETGELPR